MFLDIQEIGVECQWGTETIKAEVWGLFAVHRDIVGANNFLDSYTVTHIPSGLRMQKELGLREARALAKALQATEKAYDWANARPPLERELSMLHKAIAIELGTGQNPVTSVRGELLTTSHPKA